MDTTTLIKQLRQSGMSQSEIARRTGIPQPRLSRWENGEVPDAADDALKLASLVATTAAQPAPAKFIERRNPDNAKQYIPPRRRATDRKQG